MDRHARSWFLVGAVLAFLSSIVTAQEYPDLSGIWQGARNAGAIRRGYELTPEGERLYERNKAAIAAQDPEIDTALQCLPTGMVRTMVGLPLVLVQSPVAVAIISEADPLARIIYLDRPHREDYWPTYMGDSVGHWEDDTLVVETVNFNTRTFTDMGGLPHSDRLRVTERYREAARRQSADLDDDRRSGRIRRAVDGRHDIPAN